MAFHGKPDRPRTFRGEFMETERGEQADHSLGLPQRDQRKVLVGLQRRSGDAIDPPAHLNQMPFTGQLPDADTVSRRGAHPEECARFRDLSFRFLARLHGMQFTIRR